jgi:hypothetical protein
MNGGISHTKENSQRAILKMEACNELQEKIGKQHAVQCS